MGKAPGPDEKCRAEAVNRPGWLTVHTYAVCEAEPCVVNGSGEIHRVVVVSDSPLQYRVTVRGRCVTDGVAYVDSGEWAPGALHLDGRRKRRVARTQQADGQLVAVHKRDNESVEVSVSWASVGYKGAGELDAPLTIQLDTRPSAP
ncbi:hypothetical protein SAMN05216284_118107 [Micromonospora sediminimaris]|uniref:Uncharacterized protein n=2 Tax=Micromonosporaceae TaxID=28056 RepID=A0A9W5UWA0_9ACTN|nr:hypothetical protein Vse01_54150 [Micromonospora sediminimaris]SFD53139.1 hypothetical protein SAMN05216284_118107 [Micromonospora sediminimaris]